MSDFRKVPDPRERLLELEAALDDLWADWNGIGEFPAAPRGWWATMAKVHVHVRKIEVIEVYFDRLNLEDYRMKSGRINRRGVARALCKSIVERNEQHAQHGGDLIEKTGLRTMEGIVELLLSEK